MTKVVILISFDTGPEANIAKRQLQICMWETLVINVPNVCIAFRILFIFPLSVANGRQVLLKSTIDKIVFILNPGTGNTGF